MIIACRELMCYYKLIQSASFYSVYSALISILSSTLSSIGFKIAERFSRTGLTLLPMFQTRCE